MAPRSALALALLLAAASAAAAKKAGGRPHPYTSPSGLFIQERASKQLPGPGQHFSFGALRPWDEILSMLDGRSEDRKLLLVVRHGQAVSNFLSDTLGPDAWFAVEGTCSYDDKNGTVWGVFDADLTDTGAAEARALNSMLRDGGWAAKLTGGRPVRAVVSPLTRCLHTASTVLDGLRLNDTSVEEVVRETLGEDTCDARRSVSDPPPGGASGDAPCPFDKGLSSMWPRFRFPVQDGGADGAGRGADGRPRPFGLVSDEDTMWTRGKRERQNHQVRRAKAFLDILFERAPEPVVFVVTHSGFTRSLLLAARREPYRPVNAELVPVIVDKNLDFDEGELPPGGADDGAGDDDGGSRHWRPRGGRAAGGSVAAA